MIRMRLGLSFIFLLLAHQSARALILYGIDNTGNTTSESLVLAGYTGLPWDHVARIGGDGVTTPNGTGVYLGSNFVLTANHVLPETTPKIRINGVVYDFDNTFAPVQVAAGVDLKIFKVVAGPALTGVKIYTGTSEVGTPGVIVGWGQGRGSEIPGSGWNWGGDGTTAQRWGTNTVQAAATATYDVGYSFSALSTWFDSDQGDTEAGVTLRDSGSPLFQFHAGEWQLVGIATATEVNDSTQYNRVGPPLDGKPADENIFVRVKDYEAQIIGVIPEPSTLLYLLGTGGLFLWRRRRIS